MAKRLAWCAVVGRDAQAGKGPEHTANGFLLVPGEIFDALDAGQLVFHRLGYVGGLEKNREDGFLLLAGEGEFADDVLGLGGVGGDSEDENLAVVDGADNFLAPHGGALDAGLVDPDSDPGLPEPGDEILNPIAVGRAVTDKNFLRHEFVAAERKTMNLLQEGQPWNMRIRFAVGKETGD